MPKKTNKLDDEVKKIIAESIKVKNSDEALNVLKSLLDYLYDDQIKHKKGNKAGTKRCRAILQAEKKLCSLYRKLLQEEMLLSKTKGKKK